MKYQELRDACAMQPSPLQEIALKAATTPDTLSALLAELDAKTEALTGLVDDIDGLAGESDGVAGLHLNGDVATWGELLPGGRFERLTNLDAARAALSQGEQT